MTRSVPHMKTLLTWITFATMCTGCATSKSTLYQWGGYENSIYALYAEPGKASPEALIETLIAGSSKSAAQGMPMPPGYHAQLGYLYFQSGKPDMAMQSFVREKDLYPESTIYMDRLLDQMRK